MSKVAVIYHSGYGHTEILARQIERGAKEAGAETSLIKIAGDGAITDADWAALDAADAIVFGSPTYMAGVSGPFMMFADATAKPWFGGKWKDKLAGGFTTSGSMSGDKLSSLQYMSLLAAQHGMIWVPTGTMPASGADHVRSLDSINRLGGWLGVMAQSENVAPEQSPPQGDRDSAAQYGARIADAAKRWAK